jgi:hypothetical protein
MKLTFKPFLIQDYDGFLWRYEAFFDIKWDFEIDRSVLDVVVEIDDAAGVDLQV